MDSSKKGELDWQDVRGQYFPYKVNRPQAAAVVQQPEETWAQLQAQQCSFIIPRGSAVETHEQQSSSSAPVKRAHPQKKEEKYFTRQSPRQSNLERRKQLGAHRTLQHCIGACVCVRFLALEQTNPSLEEVGRDRGVRETERKRTAPMDAKGIPGKERQVWERRG